ncbi:hypothetical protein [Streptomyces sp. enrichment culture]|uniref:hypothetical protein n=1 Tax=Streptomyces sp. enrichment culture TaxID=1795815 RepID=UPI003F5514C8
MKTRTTAYAAFLLVAAVALTACEDTANGDTKPSAKSSPTATATATEQELTQEQKDEISKNAGLPPEPTGAERQRLLDALAKAAPDVVRYEDKAVDAARNQCSSINNGGQRLDWMASQRFTYKDVTTSEVQGKAINDALTASGFCKV